MSIAAAMFWICLNLPDSNQPKQSVFDAFSICLDFCSEKKNILLFTKSPQNYKKNRNYANLVAKFFYF